jgi:hypothetical protein
MSAWDVIGLLVNHVIDCVLGQLPGHGILDPAKLAAMARRQISAANSLLVGLKIFYRWRFCRVHSVGQH